VKDLLRSSLLVLALGWFSSCDERGQLFEELNDAPVVNFNGTDGFVALSDSMKTILGEIKVDVERYSITINVFDVNDNISTVEYRRLEGNGNLYNNGEEITDDKLPLAENGDVTFEYEPLVYGRHLFQIVVSDSFDETANVEIELIVFENLSPVAVYNSSVVGEFDKYHWRIDASESFDRDSKYGGAIIQYEYTVEGVLRRTGDNVKEHIFPAPGTYPVRVRVMDNNGVWSAYVDDNVVINN